MLDKVKVAAAQIVPAFMKKDPTVQRVCDAIHKAAANGAQLIVFPRPSSPDIRIGSLQPVSRWSQLMVEYQKNALLIPSDDTARICEAAKKANIICAVGCTELSDRPGSQTLYNTILFVDNYGKIMGRHRKLMPTHAERTVWGMGDASDLKVFDTDIGRIGGLVCFEHHITLLKAALAVKGEEIHCAVWPGWVGARKTSGNQKEVARRRSQRSLRHHLCHLRVCVRDPMFCR
jgi:amidase/nitrilase